MFQHASLGDVPYFIVAVTLLLLGVDGKFSSLPPLHIGTWTNFGYPDPGVQADIRGVTDGMRAAVMAVNAEGGIFGRQLVLDECEATFSPRKAVTCLGYLDGNGSIATLGLIIPTVIAAVEPELVRRDIFTVQSQGSRTFNRHWIYAHANDHAIMSAMIRHASQDLHFRRVGLVWAPDTGVNAHLVPEAESLCVSLGMTLTGVLGVNLSQFGYLQKNQKVYQTFLSGMPQAIVFLGSSVPSNLDVMVDLLNRSATGNGVTTELTILTWEGAAQIFQNVAAKMINLGHPEAIDRLRMVSGLPHLLDFRYAAVQHAFRDFTAYFGNTSFTLLQNDYFFYSFSFWMQLRFISNVLRSMNPNNMTRAAFMDKVFDSNVVTVDDLTFGMFADTCTGMRAAMEFFCECNEGYRAVETYYMTRSLQLEPVRNGTVTTSFGECARGTSAIVPSLVYLRVAPNDTLLLNAAAEMLLGAQLLNTSRYENCTVGFDGVASNASLTDFDQAVAKAVADRVVSVMFPSIILPAMDSAPLIIVDPLYFPAQLASSVFDGRTLHIFATLQQEIHAIASAAVLALGRVIPGIPATFSSVVHAADASAIEATIGLSLNTFGVSLSQLLRPNPLKPLAMPATLSGFLFVFGVTTAEDVRTVVAFLVANPSAVVMLAFNELSVLYAAFLAQAQKQHVETRVVFATSLTNWNLPSNNTANVASGYFAAFPDAAKRTPLTLRGFVTQSAVRKVADQITPALITPDAFVSKWYSISVVAVSADIVLGPFSLAACYSALDSTCETNTGARTVRVLRLSDVANTTAAQHAPSSTLTTYLFQSGRIEYKPLPTSAVPLPPGVVGGIATGSAIGAVALSVFVWWLRTSGKRNNRNAPVEPSVPTTVIFTDIESSTSLWAAIPVLMAPALDLHHDMIRQLVAKHKCYEVKTIGDAFMIATSSADAAVLLATELQHTLFECQQWPTEIDDMYCDLEVARAQESNAAILYANLPEERYRSMWNGLRVRIGIHTGPCDIKLDPVTGGYDYYGPTVNAAARTEAQANGGQVLMTKATVDALSSAVMTSLSITSIGDHELRGVAEKMTLYQLVTIPGRKFVERECEIADPLENSSVSSRNAGDKYAKAKDPWVEVVGNILVTLLSTMPRERHPFLSTFCERWRINVQSLSRHGQDPHVEALAKRLGPLMQRKYGAFSLNNNYVETSSTSSGQSASRLRNSRSFGSLEAVDAQQKTNDSSALSPKTIA